MYIYGGLCQLFIVVQVLALWRLAYYKTQEIKTDDGMDGSKLEQTLNQLKKFECKETILFIAICVMILAVEVTSFVLEIKKKAANTHSFIFQKLVQLAINFMINIAIAIAFICTLRNFFKMLHTIGMRSKKSINFLKAMLIVLAVSFFFRATLLALIIIDYQMINHSVWTPVCTWLTSAYLFLGEIVPIGFTFWYHLYTGP